MAAEEVADETLLEAFVDFDEDADFKGKDRGSRKQENKRGRMKVARERVRTGPSCPKARVGHRYPCPAEQFTYGSLLGKQAFGPEGGQSPVEHRGSLYTKRPETADERLEPAP